MQNLYRDDYNSDSSKEEGERRWFLVEREVHKTHNKQRGAEQWICVMGDCVLPRAMALRFGRPFKGSECPFPLQLAFSTPGSFENSGVGVYINYIITKSWNSSRNIKFYVPCSQLMLLNKAPLRSLKCWWWLSKGLTWSLHLLLFFCLVCTLWINSFHYQ